MRTTEQVKKTRRNIGATEVLKVRLQPELLARLEEVSDRKMQPVSTTARQILAGALGLIEPPAGLEPPAGEQARN